MNTNGVLSFGQPHTSTSSGGSNFDSVSSPPIIAPFWDDINVNVSGTIYYSQDSSPTIAELFRQEVLSQYAISFSPSLVFVATWDRVAQFGGSSSIVNTFQVVVASDGARTFVRFIYGDIQWGGPSTLIGVTAGDGVNFIMHPASLSSSVLLIANTSEIYRVDGELP